jgi:hypothetical protein
MLREVKTRSPRLVHFLISLANQHYTLSIRGIV